MTARIERVSTSGVFSLDGQDFEVENNVWLLGDDDEVIVIDAAHDATAILRAVRGRRVVSVVCTHGHNDHINAAVEVADKTAAPVLLRREDRPLWEQVYRGREPDDWLLDRADLRVAETDVHVLATPGHTWGAVSLYVPRLRAVFTGDTLFAGGPGATGRSFSDFPTIIASIRDRLLTLPGETTVHTGHGAETTIAAEAPHLGEWLARGY